MEKNRKKRIGLAAIALTTLFSCFTIGATTARYYSEMTGTGSVTIAKFSILAESSNGTPSFDFAEGATTSADYKFTVTNDGDVLVIYDVLVELPSALPDGVTITFAIDGYDGEAQVSGFTYTFENVGRLESKATATHTLTVSTESFTEDVSLEGVTVYVIATQVQPE